MTSLAGVIHMYSLCLGKKCCRILAITLPNINRFFKLFHCKKKKMKFPTKSVQNFQHFMLVKCITHYYCTVNNMFHAVPNDQQTLFQFINIMNTQFLDLLLMMPQIMYATRLRSGLSDVAIWTLVLPAPETRQCLLLCMWDSCTSCWI